MGVERELKLGLASQADYESLCAALPEPEKIIEQANSYWDFPDARLGAAEALLRLRVTLDKAYLTLKQRTVRNADGYFESSELENDVDLALGRAVATGSAPFDRLSGVVIDALDVSSEELATLSSWGALHNRRRRTILAPGFVAEVDRTEFTGGRIDWEVEIESADPVRARALLDPYFREAGVDVFPQYRTKCERLRAAIAESRRDASSGDA